MFVLGFLRQHLAELLLGVGREDFVEPRGLGSLVFAGKNLDDIALLELAVEVAHFAVDLDADDVTADFAMKAEGEVEWKGTFGQVDDVTFRRVNEDLVSKEVEAELFKVDFFTLFELGGGVLKLSNPKEVGG